MNWRLRGNKIYNAIPGRDNANILSGESHFYSNSGIIRIEFKDILVDHNGNEPSWYDPANTRDTFHGFREYLITNEPGTYTRSEEGWNDGINDGVNEPPIKLLEKSVIKFCALMIISKLGSILHENIHLIHFKLKTIKD